MMAGVKKSYQPPVCRCSEAQKDLENRIQENEMANWKSKALDILKRSDLETSSYTDKRFNNWDVTRNNGDAGRVSAIVNDYVDSVSLKSENWAIFTGPYGTGKTHLAIAAIRKIAAQNLWKPHVMNWPETCVKTRESWNDRSMQGFEAATWNKARDCKLLLIDDLDKTATDEKSMEKLLTVINTRYERQLPTVITMNRKLLTLNGIWSASGKQHLNDTGKAVLSRIRGQLMIEIEFRGKDQRIA